MSIGTETGVWTELDCGGVTPPARENHAMVAVDNVLYMFGGSEYGKLSNDLFKLEIGIFVLLNLEIFESCRHRFLTIYLAIM